MTHAKRLLVCLSFIAAVFGGAVATGGGESPDDNHVTGGTV